MIATNKKSNTLNRDVSWMFFNKRILDEAANKKNPILERLKFIGIYSSNLDEFFRVRVATLRRMIEIEDNIKSVKSDSKTILKQVLKLNEQYSKDLDAIFVGLIEELKFRKIHFVNETTLNQEQIDFIETFYKEELMNSLFPILVSRMDDIPRLDDKSVFMAVKMSNVDNGEYLQATTRKKEYALIQTPTSVHTRFIILPSTKGTTSLIFIDDVIRYCLPKIFASLHFNHFEAYNVKFTRDSEMDFDNTIYQSMPEKVSKAVKSRKEGIPVRFVYDKEIPTGLLRFVEKLLNIDKNGAHIGGNRYHNLKDFISFPDIKRPDLKYPAQLPMCVPALDAVRNIMELIQQKDQYLHYPYHSFDYFIRLIREAAISPDVKTIKISLYRLAKNSKVVKALICAAMNGKKVTAVVELLARFDESSNINWAVKMKEAGIDVVFGVEGLKVHSKLMHITSRKGDIACVSTGNFHEGTATIYTDFTVMTANRDIVNEVDEVFNFIEHPYLNPMFHELIVSPNYTRKRIISLIKNEIENAKKGLPAYIYMKINHIVDDNIIAKLYQASNAGVDIKLLVRGNCSIITGVKNQSEHIQVLGIIDRYLEHSRIMIFANGGDEKYYIGSCDLMVRNLDNRIEVFAPIYDKDIQRQLKLTLEAGFKDNTNARIVNGVGTNEINITDSNLKFRSQTELYKAYQSSN